MTENEPKILFGNLKGFPAICDNGKIDTGRFLEAAREIVTLIEKFGKLFSPVVYDINGNIEKLTRAYEPNKDAFHFLEDMIALEAAKPGSFSKDAILWLKRALQLIEKFFSNILDDGTCQESLKSHIKEAYTVTLKPHHNWIAQQGFSVIYRLIPYRSTLVGTGAIHSDNMKSLESFLQPMRMHLQQIEEMLVDLKVENGRQA